MARIHRLGPAVINTHTHTHTEHPPPLANSFVIGITIQSCSRGGGGVITKLFAGGGGVRLCSHQKMPVSHRFRFLEVFVSHHVVLTKWMFSPDGGEGADDDEY
jgi:hypothetical protein